jgi:hypothetical protein
MAAYARAGVKQLFESQQAPVLTDSPKKSASLFSLQNRLSA